MIVNEPLHAALEAGEAINDFRFERLHGEKRDESNHGADFKEVLLSVGQLQHVVKEAVLVVPKRAPAEAKIIHGGRCKRSARRICWRHLRKRDLLWPVRERWPACSSNTCPSSLCRRIARDGPRWAAAPSGQILQCCRAPGIRPIGRASC